MDHWRTDGEDAYADWFKKVYLSEPWSRWYTMSAIPGIIPSQNALESHNGVIKTCGVRVKRAKTGIVLNDSMPCILGMVGAEAAKGSFGHYCEGPLQSQMVHRALLHIAPDAHFKKHKTINRKRVVRSIYFNSSQYMDSPNRAAGEEVTNDRVKRYCEAKEGKLHKEDTVLDINLHYLSLHEVEFLGEPDMASSFHLSLQPVITDVIRVLASLRS
ncbi:hypothetical protein KRP22_002330 [Phytophthora ramorum]|uniref:uncharacterized protein n=1 Tax=Phytophthora ramorum TaxID=164328 RepID=UPI0030A0454B|nr:hypothetical protein KRP23_1008 [Phytophthora ramorum]KAH7510120.1 hypothetical protein KRP22_1613 [Phytophthora ramorum]